MLKNKNHRFRRMSSAALVGLAIYGSSISPAWANEIRPSRRQEEIRIQKSEGVNKVGEITVGEGTVKSTGQNMFVVTRKKDGKDFTVTIDNKTKIFQGFGKKVVLSEVQVGDRVFVKGKVLNSDVSTIAAKIVRDMSIKARMTKK